MMTWSKAGILKSEYREKNRKVKLNWKMLQQDLKLKYTFFCLLFCSFFHWRLRSKRRQREACFPDFSILNRTGCAGAVSRSNDMVMCSSSHSGEKKARSLTTSFRTPGKVRVKVPFCFWRKSRPSFQNQLGRRFFVLILAEECTKTWITIAKKQCHWSKHARFNPPKFKSWNPWKLFGESRGESTSALNASHISVPTFPRY